VIPIIARELTATIQRTTAETNKTRSASQNSTLSLESTSKSNSISSNRPTLLHDSSRIVADNAVIFGISSAGLLLAPSYSESEPLQSENTFGFEISAWIKKKVANHFSINGSIGYSMGLFVLTGKSYELVQSSTTLATPSSSGGSTTISATSSSTESSWDTAAIGTDKMNALIHSICISSGVSYRMFERFEPYANIVYLLPITSSAKVSSHIPSYIYYNDTVPESNSTRSATLTHKLTNTYSIEIGSNIRTNSNIAFFASYRYALNTFLRELQLSLNQFSIGISYSL